MKTGFKKTGKLYKGNTHMHTTISDGKMEPEEVFQKYKSRGYSFVVLTDHIKYFNSDRYNADEFLVIPGVEIHVEHDWDGNRDHHVTGMYDPSKGETFEDKHQFNVPKFTEAQGRVDILKNNANLAIYAHPIWSRVEPEELLKINDYDAIEIWNHECDFWSNTGNATFHWDYLLRKGRHVNGVASDDVHQKDDRSMGGYIMVQAKKLDNVSIADAIKRGDYYSSTGPEIEHFYLDDGILYAKGSDCKSISFINNARNRRYSGENETESINHAEHKLTGNEKYVRVEFEDFEGKHAWSNPIYIEQE